MTARKGPTLTDAKGMGGIIAQDGFDYQVWDALIRLPTWLRNPAFEGMAVEVLEDLEARFFAPHAPNGHLLERFQAKSGTLDRSELIEVFTSFRAFESAHPHAARVQTLVTPALPAKLNWVARDPGRIRRARPFYSPFADIRAASDDKLRDDLVAEFGHELGGFVAEGVEITLRTLPDRGNAEAHFNASLQAAFPDLDVTTRKLQAAFGDLSSLVSQSRGDMLTRARLLDVLGEALDMDLIPDRRLLHLYLRSDRNGQVADALEIDASGFSGGAIGSPEVATWRTDLVTPVERAARWAREHGYERATLSGSYRLSTAITLGWAFRSAVGFDIDIPTRSGPWATDEHPALGAVPPSWTISQPSSLVNERLVVGIGVIRDPGPDILGDLALADGTKILTAVLPQALTDGSEAQASVQVIKSAIAQAVAQLRPAGIDLYYVGPAALAVALGHRWNALPPTQLHEFISSTGRYMPTATIG